MKRSLTYFAVALWPGTASSRAQTAAMINTSAATRPGALLHGMSDAPRIGLELHALEERLRDRRDRHHHRTPDAAHVDDVAAPALGRGEDGAADLVGLGGEQGR